MHTDLQDDPENIQAAKPATMTAVRSYKDIPLHPMSFGRRTLLYRVKMGMTVSNIELAILMVYVCVNEAEELSRVRGDEAERKFWVDAMVWADEHVTTPADEETIITLAKEMLDEIDRAEKIEVVPDPKAPRAPKKKDTPPARK